MMPRNRFVWLPKLGFLAACFALSAGSAAAPSSIEGRWDLTLDKHGKQVPSWLEVHHSGIETLVGYFVADGGSARPIAEVVQKDGQWTFSIPPQWDKGNRPTVMKAFLRNDSLIGNLHASDGNTYAFTGVRAPRLIRDKEPQWGSPIPLFNGKNTEGWTATGKNQWSVVNGILTNNHPGSNLITTQTFTDFKLHIEFRYPKGSNSGVYLRGRYEVQVSDNFGDPAMKDFFGAIYGFIEPSHQMAKAPGEWQSFDITLIGRQVTLVANGRTIICNQVIPGITGGALDSHEGMPGPIMLQGDHGMVEYRNIVIRPGN